MMGWQWHQPDDMQIICTSLQTDNHASTSPVSFLQAECPSCCPTNSIKALKDEAISSPVAVYTTASNHCTYPLRDGQLSSPRWFG